MHNRFFLVLPDDPNLSQIKGVIVGGDEPISIQRHKLNLSMMTVMLFPGDTNDYAFLQPPEFTDETIVIEINNAEWISDNPDY